MIRIAGSVARSFTFPADLPTTRAYFTDYAHVFGQLPHIRRVKTYAPGQFRMLYHTTELSLYEVKIYCDLQTRFDRARQTLVVTPLHDHAPIKSKVTLKSLVAQGLYSSESVLEEAGHHTQIHYTLTLSAALPKPFGLSMMPDRVLDRIAHSITVWRIHEIADGFIEKTIVDFGRRHRARPARGKRTR
jgi:hypothetical protein